MQKIKFQFDYLFLPQQNILFPTITIKKVENFV